MGVEVVLLKKIANLGGAGEIVSVSEGYARNFLLSNGWATLATQKAKQEAEELKQKELAEEKQKEVETKAIAQKAKGLTLFFEKEAKRGKLFGSISTEEIRESLKKEGVTVLVKQIELKEKIKELGEYEAKLVFGRGITENIKILVSDDKQSKK